MPTLKPSQALTALGIGGAALSGTVAGIGTDLGHPTAGLVAGLLVADVVLVCQAVAPYLSSIGD